jgi:DNA polymerase I-like protein with 3'-5' exonuclease and polymerase domains
VASELVREGMEDAIELDVPLVASIASGPNWADAAPEGH